MHLWVKSGSTLKGEEQSSRVHTLLRHHNDPSPPLQPLLQKSVSPCEDAGTLLRAQGCRTERQRSLLPRHIRSKSWLRLLRQNTSRLRMPAAPCMAHVSRLVPTQPKAELWDLHKTRHLQTRDTSASRGCHAAHGAQCPEPG